jgi:hypothetical protein
MASCPFLFCAGDTELVYKMRNCKDSILSLENITPQFKYPSSDEPSLLERSMQLNRSGKKEMINFQYTF